MTAALRDGRIEVGFTIGGASVEGVSAHELGRSVGVLVCGRRHALYRKGTVTRAAMLAHRAIVPRFLGLEHHPVLDQFPEAEWPRAVGCTIELLQMGVRLAEEGAGLGYFPEVSVRAQLRDGRLRALRGLPRARPPFVLRALTRERASLRPAVRLLIEGVGRCVRDATAARAG
jgi:DNA-binding transcriptional LysR family regulator